MHVSPCLEGEVRASDKDRLLFLLSYGARKQSVRMLKFAKEQVGSLSLVCANSLRKENFDASPFYLDRSTADLIPSVIY